MHTGQNKKFKEVFYLKLVYDILAPRPSPPIVNTKFPLPDAVNNKNAKNEPIILHSYTFKAVLHVVISVLYFRFTRFIR